MVDVQLHEGRVAGAHARALAQRILERCEESAAPVGSRLPTERALAAALGVSRAAIRGALALLEANGHVSREVGRGTFLRGLPTAAPPTPARHGADVEPDDVGPADVMTARQLIEPQVLPLVIAHATTRDFEEMERCLAGGDRAERSEEFEAWDFALHHAIVAASRNPLVVRMYAHVEEARRGALWGNLKRRTNTRERRIRYQQDHREIVAALRERELERALDATTAHLARVRGNLLGFPD